MADIRKALDFILESKLTQAEEILFEHVKEIMANRLAEMQKMAAADRFTEIREVSDYEDQPELLDESHKNNVTKQGRLKLIRVRVRGGKVQRRKKVSAVKGFTVRGGHVTRMSAAERRHRKMGARKAKIKRRSKKAQIHRKLVRSLRKRHQLGL